MSSPREIELKLAVAAADLPRLQQRLRRFGAPKIELLETVYHDTADFALARRGIALRVRRVGRRWMQTLKTDLGGTALSQRGEWEISAPRGRLDLARFAGTPLAALLRAEPALKIGPRFRTRFARSLWTTADGAIEIALDEGEIIVGARRAPIRELELELKAGEPVALWSLALDLAGRSAKGGGLALLPFGESKAARGVRLVRGDPVVPAKAGAKVVAAGMTARTRIDAALRAIIRAGTTVLLANAHGLLQGDDPELVHQARVAVRRMRSAIRLFRDEIQFPAPLAGDLRWIGRELGVTRDWDVLALHTLPSLRMTAAQLPLNALQTRCGEAIRRVRAAVAGARFARLALRLLQWADIPAAPQTATLKAFAPKALRRAQRRLLDSARFFVALPAPEQHRVRILAKRLRYAIDVLAAAFPGAALHAHSEHLSSLQDRLGELNDLMVAQRLLPQLAGHDAQLDAQLEAALIALKQRQSALALAAEAALLQLAQLRDPWSRSAHRGRDPGHILRTVSPLASRQGQRSGRRSGRRV